MVSKDNYGGTIDNVAMRFTNRRGEVCYTNHESLYLSDVRSFSGGSTLVFDADQSSRDRTALGDCATGNFRPDEELQVEILTNTAGFFILSYWYDGYTFSSIEVTFGGEKKYGVERSWRYGATSCDGCGVEGGWWNHNIGHKLKMTKL